MSEPKRYSLGMRVNTDTACGLSSSEPWVYEDSNGLYVKHSDYLACQKKEETDRLDWEEAYAVLRKEHEELKTECNKLRKAVLCISDIMSNFDRHYFYKIREHLE